MSQDDYILPETVDPSNFPAKLWRMVNNPANSAICWNKTGEVILINQQLFERLVLSPCTKEGEDSFKTKQFSSFVRQLNLYGFRKFKKKYPTISDDDDDDNDDGTFKSSCTTIHHFFNPSFRRDNPALLVNLTRLTVDNKAKMNCGIDVKCRAPSKQEDGSEKHLAKGEPFSHKRACKVSPHPYFTNRKQLLPTYNGTPVPPRPLTHGHILGPPYSPVLSTPLQQGVGYRINYGSPNFKGIHPQNEQYQPGFYSPACQYFRPTPMAIPVVYHQANYPLNLGSYSHCSGSPTKKQDQKPDVTLDRVFQMADEMMPRDHQGDTPQNVMRHTGPPALSALGDGVTQTDSKTGTVCKRSTGSGHRRGQQKGDSQSGGDTS